MIQPVGLLELTRINDQLAQNMRKLSTGLKINKPSDDPAGYAAGKKIQKEIQTNRTFQSNLEREINQQSTISSKLDSASNIGMKINELLDQASSSAVSLEEKNAIQNDINQLGQELDNTLTSIEGKDFTAEQFGFDADSLDISSEESLAQAKVSVYSGINSLVQENQNTGTTINSSFRQKQQLAQNEINQKATLSTIRDANMIESMIAFTNKSILQQLAIKTIKKSSQNNASQALSLFA